MITFARHSGFFSGIKCTYRIITEKKSIKIKTADGINII